MSRAVTREDAWFLTKLAATTSALCALVCAVALAPVWVGLIVQHGHASPLWMLGLPVSLTPAFMLMALIDDWTPRWLS